MQHIVENMSRYPGLIVFLTSVIFLFSFFTNYLLLDSLLKMHRSKSAVKKLKKEYTFLERLRLMHLKGNFRHAAGFCNGLVIYQKIGCVCFSAYLLAALLIGLERMDAIWIARLTVGFFVLFELPAFVLNRILARPVVFGRFRAFSFEKYHNTENDKSLL